MAYMDGLSPVNLLYFQMSGGISGKWFSGECAQRGLGIGLDDYTVGWIGNGYYPDELDTMDIFKGYKGELEINAIPVKKDEVFQYDVPADLVAVVAWPGKINLETSIKNGADYLEISYKRGCECLCY